MTNDYGNLELHKVLLSAMKDVDKICRENGMQYFLYAGTLLGAVNHRGFIPWDDDVDIALRRCDYEKFIDIVRRDYADRYFMQTYQTDPQHTNNRAVLRVLGTKLTYFHEEPDKVHCEIGVDIVPLDNVPSCRLLQKLQQTEVWVLDAAVQIKQGRIIPHHPVMRLISLLSHIDRVKLGEWIDRATERYNNKETEKIGLLSYTHKNPYTGVSGYDNDILMREWFDQPAYLPFEDTEFMAIRDPHADLVHRYGEHYRDPYPEEKRITKHDIKEYFISDEVKERAGL
ncbi:MAG: phosphorylcholine transferase LicD [Acutalibacteraceae bacterium]